VDYRHSTGNSIAEWPQICTSRVAWPESHEAVLLSEAVSSYDAVKAMGVNTKESSLADAPGPLGLTHALSHSGILGSHLGQIDVQETHLSYLFFAEREVYKLKKPVLRPFIDLSTVAARLYNANLEIQLNRRLAPNIYYGLKRITRHREGFLELDGQGETIDWMVHMRRLPSSRMLDILLVSEALSTSDIDLLAQTLVNFYASTKRIAMSPSDYLAAWLRRLNHEKSLLLRTELAVPETLIKSVVHELETILTTDEKLFSSRVCDSQIIDGHGDLRPEHICLAEDCTIFDCLEFSASLRALDTADELAYLDMELNFIGGADVAEALRATYLELSGNIVPPIVHSFYFCYRALLRARLSIWHLYDCQPADIDKWRRKAAAYLDLAAHELGKNR
jgi:aminoglycoside phosphotransferase family enzyme